MVGRDHGFGMMRVRGIGIRITNRNQHAGYAGAQALRPVVVRAHFTKSRQQDVMQPLASPGPIGRILDGLDEPRFIGTVLSLIHRQAVAFHARPRMRPSRMRSRAL